MGRGEFCAVTRSGAATPSVAQVRMMRKPNLVILHLTVISFCALCGAPLTCRPFSTKSPNRRPPLKTRLLIVRTILGLSIPLAAKKEIIETFRRHCRAPILSLWGRGEQILDAVNYLEFSNKPDDFVRSVATILASG